MTFTKLFAILALFSCTAFFCACGGNGANQANAPAASNKPAENANIARSNAEELGVIVNLPFDTEDVAWKEDAAHKKVIAVLRFSPEDSAKVVAEAQKVRPPEPAVISTETWFPAELIAQSEMSGDDEIKGQSFSADQFFQEPFTSGRVVRVETTDYFVLELSAK